MAPLAMLADSCIPVLYERMAKRIDPMAKSHIAAMVSRIQKIALNMTDWLPDTDTELLI